MVRFQPTAARPLSAAFHGCRCQDARALTTARRSYSVGSRLRTEANVARNTGRGGATMTIYQAIYIAIGVYLTLLAVTTYFARPTRRRFLGALAGGVAVAVVGVGIESLFHNLGFWHYPSVGEPYGPVALFPLLGGGFSMAALFGRRGEPGVGLS